MKHYWNNTLESLRQSSATRKHRILLKKRSGHAFWCPSTSVKNSARSRIYLYFFGINFWKKSSEIRFLLVVWLCGFLYGLIFGQFREVERKIVEICEGYGCDRDRWLSHWHVSRHSIRSLKIHHSERNFLSELFLEIAFQGSFFNKFNVLKMKEIRDPSEIFTGLDPSKKA